MDLDLDDDQTALRDGIAALLAGRFDSDRVRAGFDRAMYDELAAAGVFALRADGFAWADAVVVFEQLGRHCVPGPLVACLLAGDGRNRRDRRASAPSRCGSRISTSSKSLYVLDGDAVTRVDPRTLAAEPSPWPLDPLTPVARVDELPGGAATDIDGAEWRRAGAVLTAAFQLGLADRCTELAVAYAKERVQFDRRDRVVPGDQAHLRRHGDAHRGRARRGVRGRCPPRRAPSHSGTRPRWIAASRPPSCSRATPRSPTARRPRRCTAGWASRGRSTSTCT